MIYHLSHRNSVAFLCLLYTFYNSKSKSIIVQKPSPRPMVAIFLLPDKLSGKSSMQETAIIVPAANVSKNGKTEEIMPVKK